MGQWAVYFILCLWVIVVFCWLARWVREWSIILVETCYGIGAILKCLILPNRVPMKSLVKCLTCFLRLFNNVNTRSTRQSTLSKLCSYNCGQSFIWLYLVSNWIENQLLYRSNIILIYDRKAFIRWAHCDVCNVQTCIIYCERCKLLLDAFYEGVQRSKWIIGQA